jgi:hypothetical protein
MGNKEYKLAGALAQRKYRHEAVVVRIHSTINYLIASPNCVFKLFFACKYFSNPAETFDCPAAVVVVFPLAGLGHTALFIAGKINRLS